MLRLRLLRPPSCLFTAKNPLFRPILLPRPLLPVTITRSATVRHSRPAPPRRADPVVIRQVPPPPSDEYHIPEEGPEPPMAGRGFLVLFALMAAPITFAFQFPTRMLPPTPDPPHLQHLSKKPLTLGTWVSSPWQSFQLLMFRLRRGEYVQTLPKHFSFKPLNYLGLSSEPNDLLKLALGKGGVPEQWRWWTWGTYMFAHGGIFHFGFCFVAASSLVPMFAAQYGVARSLAFFFGSGIGAAALGCQVENYLHGQDVKDGKGIQIVQRETTMPNGTQATVNGLTPAPGYNRMFDSNIGSSAALMAMFMTTAIAMPQSKWGLMFMPFTVGARPMVGALVAWDLAGALGYTPDMGVAHVVHLCGDIVGLLMYALWLRRLPASRLMAWCRKREGFW